MRRKLRDSVVVITGASSGIGRAAALAFARRGATVVAAARREQPLQQLIRECESLGARALAVPTDVTDEAAVRSLARRAIETFGRIDVWVNNAAVALFGRFEEIPPEAFRRVIETNYFGYVHGARAVLPYFREQGSGVLINNASMVGAVGQPYTSPYVSTKWAIRGLGECLRMELALDGARDIHVCTLLPASIDTPLFQHAANYTGRLPKAMRPTYDAEMVAELIVGLAERPRRERFAGTAGRMIARQHTLAPGLTEAMLARQVDKDHFQDRPAEPTSGNLFEPMPEWTTIGGGWKAPRRGMLARLAVPGLVTTVGGAAAWAWLRPALKPGLRAGAIPGGSALRPARRAARSLPFGRRQPTGLGRVMSAIGLPTRLAALKVGR